MASVVIYVLSAIALLFFVFAMGAIILLARRMALLTDDIRSLVDILKGKIPPAADKVTEAADEARLLLGNARKMSDFAQNLQTLLLSNRKLAYYAGVFLAGLRTGFKIFMKVKQKRKKEADECGRQQGQ